MSAVISRRRLISINPQKIIKAIETKNEQISVKLGKGRISGFKKMFLVLFLAVAISFFVSAEDAKAGLWSSLVNYFSDTTTEKAMAQFANPGSDAVGMPDADAQDYNSFSFSLVQAPSYSQNRNGPVVVQNVSLMQTAPPSLVELDENQVPKKEIIKYTIKEGDNLFSIADIFDINVETIVWANPTSVRGELIRAGDELNIPPIVGVIHTVKKGDTISGIANLYKAEKEDIIEYNSIEEDKLSVGLVIMVPFGELVQYSKPIPVPKYVARIQQTKLPPSPRNVLVSQIIKDSWLVSPTTGYNQKRKHSNNGVDISNPCGTSVVAVAQGVVIQANITTSGATFAFGGYGNNVRIQHKNGAITLYGHLQKVFVVPGEAVNQGDVIGLMGGRPGHPGSGRSTGCHLHFEVRGALNPFLY